MAIITRQYANTNNDGRERVSREGYKYYINSDFGKGFCGKKRVSRRTVEWCMTHTNAPASVIAAILGNEVTQ